MPVMTLMRVPLFFAADELLRYCGCSLSFMMFNFCEVYPEKYVFVRDFH